MGKAGIGKNDELVKSRQRVADHGEVFTPSWMVDAMIDLVKDEAERIDSRFLEPACGSGNFLLPVLKRKFSIVKSRYRLSKFELRHHALAALMSIYGIELLADNVAECRGRLQTEFLSFIGVAPGDDWALAGETVLQANIVQGDALSLMNAFGEPITFPEWGYLGKGNFQRRDFKFEKLTERSSIEGTLFEMLDEEDFFRPIKTYSAMTVQEISK